MQKLAYFMCHKVQNPSNFNSQTLLKCKNPYFAGLNECQEGARDYNPGFESFFASFIHSRKKTEDLLCGGCSGTAVVECPTHGKEFIEYKCYFCCSIASWFCWGQWMP